MDTDTDRALSAAEVRQVVTSTLQTMFGSADTDRDGQLSPTELNAAAYGLAWAGVEAAFQAADANRDNALSQDEFTKALDEPAKAFFSVLDADFNGQLTTQEIQRSGQVLSSRLRGLAIPRARNSVDRLVKEARAPGEIAPTPEIQLPRPTNSRRPNP